MEQEQSPSKGFPKFERPSEAVVYWTLENLCGGAGGRYMLPLAKLAKRCGLSVSTVNRAVLSLVCRGLLKYRPGQNQSLQSIFEIPLKGPGGTVAGRAPLGMGKKLSPKTTARPKIGIPNRNDSDLDNNNVYTGDSDIGKDVHRQNEDTETEAAERLAYRVAEGLDDMKNLRLYQSYCRRFPADLVLKAFVRAREPAPDKIKVSRGALFNFLVQLYAKKRNPKNNSGGAAGQA